MSDSLSIAAITKTLRKLIEDCVVGDSGNKVNVTTKPLDKVRSEDENKKKLNLYLYHTVPNGGLRNMDMPGRTRPGEVGYPPLALDLFYLLTAYGEDDDDIQGQGHRLLGEAMSALHDHPVLGRDEIRIAEPSSNLNEQVERIRITSHPMSMDEMSKLWNSFQTEYRLSTAYQVSVVQIESTRIPRTPEPVLTRGRDDRGVFAVAEASPVLSEVRPPSGKPGAELGDEVILRGANLSANNTVIRLTHPLLAEPIEINPTETQIVVDGKPERALMIKLPSDSSAPAKWPIGFYKVVVVVRKNQVPPWTSNALPFAIVPTTILTVPASPTTPPEVPAGDFDVELTCIPRVVVKIVGVDGQPIVDGQRVELLFGDQIIEATDVETDPGDTTKPSLLKFRVKGAQPRDIAYTLRVRVAEVDSIPVDFSHSPLRFNPALQVTVVSP